MLREDFSMFRDKSSVGVTYFNHDTEEFVSDGSYNAHRWIKVGEVK
jgi:hypothetical protein